MNNLTKIIALFLILFAGIGVYSYAETILTIAAGTGRLYEKYKEEGKDDIRNINFDLNFNRYKGNKIGGWFVKASYGKQLGVEWKEELKDTKSAVDLRLCVGPSFIFRPGTKILIPISFGPAVSNFRTNGLSFDKEANAYQTLSVGALADVSIVFVPLKRFALQVGVNASYDFLQFEKGIPVSGNEKPDSDKFVKTDNGGFKFGVYFGIGVKLGSTKKTKTDDVE